MPMIYADNAASTKLDTDAFEAMKPYLLEEYGNPSQPYSFSRSAKAALKQARETVASCINAKPCEIYFTSGGTESDNWAIKSPAFSDTNFRTTIISQIEHPAVINACSTIERLSHPIAYLDSTQDGVITPVELERVINNRTTRLVSVMLVNNEIGTVQPVKELCSIAHAHGALFHTDAVPALGHIPVDVHELGIDMLSASAHKFNGPKGIGFLYMRKGAKILPYADGGGQEFGLRSGTENVASIVGMAVALKKNCEVIETNAVHLRALEQIVTESLDVAKIDYLRNGNKNRVPGSVSLSFRDISGEELLHHLDSKEICVSAGAACKHGNAQISHVLKAICLPAEYVKGTIRITFGKENTQEEARTIAKELLHIIKG